MHSLLDLEHKNELQSEGSYITDQHHKDERLTIEIAARWFRFNLVCARDMSRSFSSLFVTVVKGGSAMFNPIMLNDLFDAGC